jgi:hypothetical protein
MKNRFRELSSKIPIGLDFLNGEGEMVLHLPEEIDRRLHVVMVDSPEQGRKCLTPINTRFAVRVMDDVSVKITAYNDHRSAPFPRALVDSPPPNLLAREEPTTLSNQLSINLSRKLPGINKLVLTSFWH